MPLSWWIQEQASEACAPGSIPGRGTMKQAG